MTILPSPTSYTYTHTPVLAAATLEWLAPQRGEIVVDGTLGLGGHSQLIAEIIGENGHLIGFDRDATALHLAEKNLAATSPRKNFIPRPFAEMATALHEIGIAQVARILLDLGVSSMQFDDATRGFAFRFDGELDMRMEQTATLTAAKIVNEYNEIALADLFYQYGEERAARKIAARIVEVRRREKITTTTQLAQIIARVIPRYGKTHPATRVFQALRIAVNDELGQLAQVLPVALKLLKSGGRLAIITFHSLEDRVVKNFFKTATAEKIATLPHKKAIPPTYQEVRANRRARSAKLRILEKI